MDKRDKELLVEVTLNKGNVDKIAFESPEERNNFLSRHSMLSDYEMAKQYKIEAQYANSSLIREKNLNMANDFEKKIDSSVNKILSAEGIKIEPNLSTTEKENQIKEQLSELGIGKEDIDKILQGGIDKMQTKGEDVSFTMKDTPETRKILEEKGLDFKADKDGLKLNAKMYVKEGLEIEDTPKNRKVLEDNELAYAIKAEKERKLFVPLQAKKVATLVAASVIIGPLPALVLQMALNQSGLLDRMLDQHLVSLSQKKALENGMTIKAKQKVNGKEVEQFLWKDQQTGNVNRVNVSDIQIPKTHKGVELTPGQIHQLKDGKVIEVVSKEGTNMAFRIDMNEVGGIRAMYKEMKNDREYMAVPKPESPDVDKLKYISIKGAKGITDIYGSGNIQERDSFLEKFNLNNDFKNIQATEKELKMAKLAGEPTTMLAKELTKQVNSFKEGIIDLVFDMEREKTASYKR